MKDTEKTINEINERVQHITSLDELTWEEKYDKIFSKEISRRVHSLISLDYYDPDTSYKEDVLAFTNALDEWVSSNKI